MKRRVANRRNSMDIRGMLRHFGKILAVALVFATAARGAVEEKIENAFGFRLGDVFVPDASAKPTGAAGDTISYMVKAPKPFRSMQTCRVSVTPKTSRIVAIVANTKPFDTVEEAQREGMLVVTLLTEKYALKPEKIEQPAPAPAATGTKPAGPKAPPLPPPPKPITTMKVRRSSTDSPYPTDVTYKQGNRSIVTELVTTTGTIDQTPGKPTVQVSYADQDLAQSGARERQELEKERARAWIEEQATKTDASGL
jgi:hypothetical protein